MQPRAKSGRSTACCTRRADLLIAMGVEIVNEEGGHDQAVKQGQASYNVETRGCWWRTVEMRIGNEGANRPAGEPPVSSPPG